MYPSVSTGLGSTQLGGGENGRKCGRRGGGGFDKFLLVAVRGDARAVGDDGIAGWLATVLFASVCQR